MIRQVTYENTYNGLPIITPYSGESMGSYTPILDGIYWLINGMVEKHGKVYSFRFDVRYPVAGNYVSDNKLISRFIEALIKYYDREKFNPKYLWCRERVYSENPHYHFIFLVNGNKVQNPYGILTQATDLWGKCLNVGASGLINYCQNGTMVIRNSPHFNEQFGEFFYRASYLAKVYSKNSTKGVRNFGMSRVEE
jgi:hypothetical protein